MEDVPYYFAGNFSLAINTIVQYQADADIGAAVSFTIDPVDVSGDTIEDIEDLAAVCINDVAATGKLKVNSEKNNDDDD